MQDTLRATSAGRARRRPKTYGEERVCADQSCCRPVSAGTNCETFCFSHAPARHRRMRGEFTVEYAAKHL